jgi:hypothetical protein
MYEQEIIFKSRVDTHIYGLITNRNYEYTFSNYHDSEIFLSSQNYTCIYKHCNLSLSKNGIIIIIIIIIIITF